MNALLSFATISWNIFNLRLSFILSRGLPNLCCCDGALASIVLHNIILKNETLSGHSSDIIRCCCYWVNSLPSWNDFWTVWCFWCRTWLHSNQIEDLMIQFLFFYSIKCIHINLTSCLTCISNILKVWLHFLHSTMSNRTNCQSVFHTENDHLWSRSWEGNWVPQISFLLMILADDLKNHEMKWDEAKELMLKRWIDILKMNANGRFLDLWGCKM